MPTDSPKYKEAEAKLPDALRGAYRQMVEEYEFLTHLKYGRGYVAYEVLADMVLAGWRPSGDVHPSSQLATEERTQGKHGD
jgi:hypothetical protein